jgi:membrane associated rhomboid family serine protease/Zn-finger nucleic acid-binding protein
MRRIVSGGKEVDFCTACGALWFDYGEIKELTEGRVPGPSPGETPPLGPPEAAGNTGRKDKPGAVLAGLRRTAASLACPRCGGALTAIDFQATRIPVLRCPACEGILAPRDSAAGISAKFRFLREHGAKYAALGQTMAAEAKRRVEAKDGPARPGESGGMVVPLPVIVPLADEGPETGSLPLATYTLIAVSVFLYILGQIRGAPLTLPGGLTGLPSGTGFAGVPWLPLLFAPFVHAGILPLAVGSLFLAVLGDNVEDRLGKIPYVFLYLFCGAVAGAAHVLWGKTGGSSALGSTGAVAGILGAYLVFFPNVSIRMYGMGQIVRLPAYLFACAWVIAAFFLEWGTGPIERFLYPGALSLAGNLAGFGTGILAAVLFRLGEDMEVPASPGDRQS